MSSHVRRLQYQQQQQRQAELNRNYLGSLSSIGRAATPSAYETSLVGGPAEDGTSILRPVGSVVSFDQRSFVRPPGYANPAARGGSMLSYIPPSTIAGRSLIGRPSLYAKSSLYRSRSLGASKVKPYYYWLKWSRNYASLCGICSIFLQLCVRCNF